jgi:hypothetical protein
MQSLKRYLCLLDQQLQPDPEDTGSAGEALPHELQALSGGANLSWVVKQALGSWVESSVLAGDMSQVARASRGFQPMHH